VSLDLRIHEDALAELLDAIEWYDQGEQGRGARFRGDVFRVIDRCLDWPESGPIVLAPDSTPDIVYRHAKVPHSHYRLIYVVDERVFLVVAVAHERRLPRYWSERRQG